MERVVSTDLAACSQARHANTPALGARSPAVLRKQYSCRDWGGVTCSRPVRASHVCHSSGGASSRRPGSLGGITRAALSVAAAVDKQILPVTLVSFIALGLVRPQEGVAAYNLGLSQIITVAIFIMSGLQLKRGDALAAARATGCLAFGLASILLLTPLMAWALLWVPLPSQALPIALGTAVFCCMPTTLSSGISMTAACGGNTALAILLTIASNVLGVFTMPLVLPALLGSVAGANNTNLQPGTLLAQLTKMVLIPTLLGAFARAYVPGVAAAVDRNRRAIVYSSALCLACVPWMQVSRSVSQGLTVTAADLAIAVGLGSACHLVFLAFNSLCVKGLALGGTDVLESARLQQALVLQASQKTLPIAVAVISGVTSSASSGILAAPGAAGLASIAAVVCHLTQIIIDSFLVPIWTRHLQQVKAQRKAK